MSKSGQQAASQPVDPAALAAAQTQSNVTTAQTQAALNNINTYSPYGTSIYTPYTDPNTGLQSYTLNQQLSPELQQLFSAQTGLAGQAVGAGAPFIQGGGQLGQLGLALAQQAGGFAGNITPTADLSAVPNLQFLTPGSFQTNVTTGAGGQALPGVQTALDTSRLPGIQTNVNTNFPGLVQQAQDAAYRQQTQYLDPQFTQQRQQLTQQLADQGLQPGTEAYDRAIGDFSRQQQMAYGNAGLQAVQAGNAQQQALFGQAIAGGQFANQAQQQAFTQGAQGMQLANQAQQQMFGQGTQLADLFNQSVLGAANQNIQAQNANLQRAQTAWQDPLQALGQLLSAGSSAFTTGLGGLAGALPLLNAAPTWANVPTMGGGPTQVGTTNIAGLTQAATNQNQLAAGQNAQQWQNIGGLASRALFGNQGLSSIFGGGGGLGGGGGGLFGSGGLLGSPFGGGSGLLGGMFGGSSFPAISSGVAGAIGDAGLTGMAPTAFTDAIMAMAL